MINLWEYVILTPYSVIVVLHLNLKPTDKFMFVSTTLVFLNNIVLVKIRLCIKIQILSLLFVKTSILV